MLRCEESGDELQKTKMAHQVKHSHRLDRITRSHISNTDLRVEFPLDKAEGLLVRSKGLLATTRKETKD